MPAPVPATEADTGFTEQEWKGCEGPGVILPRGWEVMFACSTSLMLPHSPSLTFIPSFVSLVPAATMPPISLLLNSAVASEGKSCLAYCRNCKSLGM